MSIFALDPLTDPRWISLVEAHPSASIFHSRGWLEALRRTYGFQPAALTTSPLGGPLTNGLVFCRVHSCITGNRLVSLPFSDHCEPIFSEAADLACLLEGFRNATGNGRYRYAQLRPFSPLPVEAFEFQPGPSFWLHRLDLRPGAKSIFEGFHKDCIQRKIRRAERERLFVTSGTAAETLDDFYRLMILTRRRHGLPPQPLAWFRNLIDCLNESIAIWVARKEGQAVAAILTCRHGRTLTYKYGASDTRYHRLGAMPCLFWAAIQDGISRGLETLDLGRSDEDEQGLVTFKDRLGATRSTLCYWTTLGQERENGSSGSWKRSLLRQACARLPERCLPALGALLYPHIA